MEEAEPLVPRTSGCGGPGAPDSLGTPGWWRAGLVLVVLLGLGLRLALLGGPWSGLASDFHNHFGAWAVGEPAQILAEQGPLTEGGMPAFWRVELADGEVASELYTHHPALYTHLIALSLRVFGNVEWAVRIVPLTFSMLSLLIAARCLRRWFGAEVALFAAAWMAALPLFAWYGMLPWTEGVLVGIGCLQLGAYARWCAAGPGAARRAFLVMCGWQFVAVLFDWTGAFMCVGIGLHALCFGRWRRFAKLLWLGVPIFLAAGLHALHMNLVLGGLHQATETKATLAAVTALPTETLAEFVRLQFGHARRFLGLPAYVLVLAGALVLLARRVRGALTETEGLSIALLTPGLLYIALFPQRSYNHDFFLMLSMPGLGVLGAWAAWRVGALLRPGAAPIVLVVAGLASTAWGAWRTLELRADRTSPQMPVIAAELEAYLAPSDAMVLTHFGRGMALPFYADAAMLENINVVPKFEQRMGGVVERTDPARPAYFLFDMVTAAQLGSAGARDLLGNPEPGELEAAFDAFVASKPRPELERFLRGFLHPLLVPLHAHLCATYASEIHCAGPYGVFQVFDLRRPLAEASAEGADE